MTTPPRSPNWDQLYHVAAAQEGLFTTHQAALAGYSPQLLAHHVSAGRMSRVRRGIYRLVHFPAGEYEALTELWLWSEQQGVFSHQTALALHELSDVLPSQIHLTLPGTWRARRLRVPEGVIVHHDDALDERARHWFGPVPATSPRRTLEACAAMHLPPELLRAAAHDALERGVVTRDEMHLIDAALQPFGGL